MVIGKLVHFGLLLGPLAMHSAGGAAPTFPPCSRSSLACMLPQRGFSKTPAVERPVCVRVYMRIQKHSALMSYEANALRPVVRVRWPNPKPQTPCPNL